MWSTPATRKFFVGAGLGPEISTFGWVGVTEPAPIPTTVAIGDDSLPVSWLAARVLELTEQLRAADSRAASFEHLILAMIATDDCWLNSWISTHLGGGFNPALAFLLTDLEMQVGTSAAELAISLCEARGSHDLVEDIPRRLTRAAAIDLLIGFPFTSTVTNASERFAQAVPRHQEQVSQLPSDSDVADCFRYQNFQQLRDAVIRDVVAREQRPDALRLLRSTPGSPDEEAAIERIMRDRPSVFDRLLPRSQVLPTRPWEVLQARARLVAGQDQISEDIERSLTIGYDLSETVKAFLSGEDLVGFAATLALYSKAKARAWRAASGRGPGVPGANPAFADWDVRSAEGALVAVYLDGTSVTAARVHESPRLVRKSFTAGDASAWWRRYRVSCLSGVGVQHALEELADVTGIGELVSECHSAPVRLLPFGRLSALPLADCVTRELGLRGLPVVTHLAGGPFQHRVRYAKAPGSLSGGSVAVVAPPNVLGASPLPFAQAEAAIVSQLTGARFKVASAYGERAGLLRMLDSLGDDGPAVWHFACHGSVVPRLHGGSSGALVLVDHEYLDSAAIAQCADAQVLVCSACDIAATPPTAESTSWPRLAVYGGAQQVVAASRPVSDPVTLALMAKFYEAWGAGADIEAALCSSQRWVEQAEPSAVDSTLQAVGLRDGLRDAVLDEIVSQRESGQVDPWAFAVFTA